MDYACNNKVYIITSMVTRIIIIEQFQLHYTIMFNGWVHVCCSFSINYIYFSADVMK